MEFKLPLGVRILIGYGALYTGIWGAFMLWDPDAYFAYANMSPDHFPPTVDFWGWFGISGGVFYGGYLLIFRRAPP